ncbi:MAG TPA: hypothetical protein VGP92_19885 [Acidimicrobiia bacterium]|jgi:hypothetical protein|nr:hypothetical protein [Acidimicrobiia bacterium]
MKLARMRAHGEEGIALELALIFLTATSVIVASLLGFADTSSQATVVFRSSRGSDYDVDAAMQADIATIRVTSGQGLVGSCASFTPAFTLNNPASPVRVDCTPSSAPAGQRHVVLSVCPTTIASPCPDISAVLRADITFYDDGSFGRALSILSWSNQ